MIQIIPSILATTEGQYQQDLTKLSNTESLQDSWLHIDFADNIFVQNQTIDPEIISKYPADFQKEAHLMVSHPKEWIEKLVEAGFKRVIFHLECEDDIQEVIDDIKNKGLEVGLAIKMDTAVEKLEPFISQVDVVLIMSIVPGFQGQPFIAESLDRIREVKSKVTARVGVDGAVKDTNIKEIMEAGADFVIMGSYLLNGDTEENLERVWEILYG